MRLKQITIYFTAYFFIPNPVMHKLIASIANTKYYNGQKIYGGEYIAKKTWTLEDLINFNFTIAIDTNKAYCIAGYINAQDKHIFQGILAIPVPLLVLCNCATKSMLLEIGKRHKVIFSCRHVSLEQTQTKLMQHECKTCPKFLTLFEPEKALMMNTE